MGNPTVVQPRQFSDEEWRVRCDLAACYRAFVKYGWTDLTYTHISARHPARADWYLINPYGLLFDEITASNLIIVNLEGEVVCGEYPYNKAGHAIHSTVLSARTDVNWVLHTHTRAGMAVSCMRCGLIPVTQQAMFLHGQVAYHPWDMQAAPGECQRLVADLGDKNVMILHNHGLLTCAATIGEAFTKLYILETACKVQADLMRSQVELVMPDDEIIKRTAAHGATSLTGERQWEAIRRSVERADPSYRD